MVNLNICKETTDLVGIYQDVRAYPLMPAGHSKRSFGRTVVVLAAAFVLCCGCLLIVFSDGNNSFQHESLIEVNAESTPSENPYCSVFSDSADCNQQAESDASKYWTSAEIREKLWSAMKALAEVICPPSQPLYTPHARGI